MPEYRLTLFVRQGNPTSVRAERTVRALLADELAGRCDLEVVDVEADPGRAESDRVITTPTLIRRRGSEVRFVCGDLRPEVVLSGLSLTARNGPAPGESLGLFAEAARLHGWSPDAAHRLDAWVALLSDVVAVGPAHARDLLRDHILGLVLPGSTRRSTTAGGPDAASHAARYQALHHMTARSPWSDDAVYDLVRSRQPDARRGGEGGVIAWVLGEHGIARGGDRVVGLGPVVAADGRATRGQRLVTLTGVTGRGHAFPMGARLHLPPTWTDDPARRLRAGVPDDVRPCGPWRLALDLLDGALRRGAPAAPVCAAGASVAAPDLALALYDRGLGFALEAHPAALVAPKQDAGLGVGCFEARELARRAGADGVYPLDCDEYDRLVVRTGPDGERHCWLVGGPGAGDADALLRAPATAAALYADLAARADYDGYAGRGWVGLHHHAALSAAAHAFLVSERG